MDNSKKVYPVVLAPGKEGGYCVTVPGKEMPAPSWLNARAEAAGIDLSAALQEALKERLGIA